MLRHIDKKKRPFFLKMVKSRTNDRVQPSSFREKASKKPTVL